MGEILIRLALAIISGLLMSRVAKKMNLPAVTAYLVAGLIIGPYCLGAINVNGLGFNTLEQVDSLNIIAQVALGFISFTIGNEFRLSQLKSMGRQAVIIGIGQAVITTILVDIVLIALHFAFPTVISIPAAIVLGAIAAATAPAATLMVVKQYKADGPLTKLLMMVVAIDDAVGLVLFAVSFGIASAIEAGSVSITGMIMEPVIEIVLSLVLGALMGYLLMQVEKFYHSRSKRLSVMVAFVMLTVGLSMIKFEFMGVHFGTSLLLVCMMAGTVFCNTCETSEELMGRTELWTAPLNVLFFVLSGAELDLKIISSPMVLFIGAIYIIIRAAGKYVGTYATSKSTKCNIRIQKYLGITLLPQAGVALGMSLTAASLLDGAIIRNVVLFAVLVYELIGPTMTKNALVAAGEIKLDEKNSARSINKPEKTHSLH